MSKAIFAHSGWAASLQTYIWSVLQERTWTGTFECAVASTPHSILLTLKIILTYFANNLKVKKWTQKNIKLIFLQSLWEIIVNCTELSYLCSVADQILRIFQQPYHILALLVTRWCTLFIGHFMMFPVDTWILPPSLSIQHLDACSPLTMWLDKTYITTGFSNQLLWISWHSSYIWLVSHHYLGETQWTLVP